MPTRAPQDERVAPETLRTRWRAAFEAAEAALRSARHILPPDELRARSQQLAAERESTAGLLHAYAGLVATAPSFRLPLSPREAQRLLGLPAEVAACIVNLDGVLVGSAALHAEAWAKTFDRFLSSRSEQAHVEVAPFHPRRDYQAYVHGRPRLEGVRAFLASRGISLAEGTVEDEPGAETVHGLANQKNAVLGQLLARRNLSPYDGAREYLELAHDARVRCAVVSASAHTDTILRRAGLSHLVDGKIDGAAIVASGLTPRPAPDIVLAACRELEASPGRAAVFETTPAGVEAARAAGAAVVVGVGRGDRMQELRAAGADLVVTGLEELLHLADAA